MKSTIEIKTRDGRCPASVFRPDDDRAYPAVLVFMDGLGYGPPMEEIAARIAAHGYVVLLPDLFYRSGSYQRAHFSIFGDPDKRKAWVEKMMSPANTANVMSDTAAFLDYLARRPDVVQPKIGTTGYCMGGNRSLAAAGHFPDRVAACASYHGGNLATDAPDSPHRRANEIKAKVYIAGAIEDPSFDDAQKQRLEQALTAAHVDHTIETYPAKHGWVPSDTPVHDAAAAERHYQTMLTLFDAVLKG
jgi:carboxymethylenebutenolidase